MRCRRERQRDDIAREEQAHERVDARTPGDRAEIRPQEDLGAKLADFLANHWC